jgi:hypothetical protein
VKQSGGGKAPPPTLFFLPELKRPSVRFFLSLSSPKARIGMAAKR